MMTGETGQRGARAAVAIADAAGHRENAVVAHPQAAPNRAFPVAAMRNAAIERERRQEVLQVPPKEAHEVQEANAMPRVAQKKCEKCNKYFDKSNFARHVRRCKVEVNGNAGNDLNGQAAIPAAAAQDEQPHVQQRIPVEKVLRCVDQVSGVEWTPASDSKCAKFAPLAPTACNWSAKGTHGIFVREAYGRTTELHCRDYICSTHGARPCLTSTTFANALRAADATHKMRLPIIKIGGTFYSIEVFFCWPWSDSICLAHARQMLQPYSGLSPLALRIALIMKLSFLLSSRLPTH